MKNALTFSTTSAHAAESMNDDIVINKTATIERCVQRVREEYDDDPSHLFDDITRQDAMILNLQRASQASIDLAMHLVRVHELGAPQTSRDAFSYLAAEGHLDSEHGERLERMVGFRNVAVHEYKELNLDIVQAIIEKHLVDFTRFAERVLQTNGFRDRRDGE